MRCFSRLPGIALAVTLANIVSGCVDSGHGSNAAIPGSNGLFFDASDRLYVASVAAGKIYILDRETGATLDVLDSAHGVHSPDDVTIDAKGIVYATNILQGSITAIAPDKSHRVIADLGWGVNSITVRDNGDIWVGRDFLGDGLYELDPGGHTPPRTVIATPGWINGMDFGPDGMLYGPVFTQDIVVRIDPATGTTDTVADGFASTPFAVKFNPEGKLYALEGKPGRLLRLDLHTGDRELMASYPPGLDNFAFDSSGRVFISSYTDGSIHEVMADASLRTIRAPNQALADWLLKLRLTGAALLVILLALLVLAINRFRRGRC